MRSIRSEPIPPNAFGTDPVYRRSYAATRKFLQRLGKRVLKRGLHYHLFRHSSATYLSTKLNRQELCYRYGWRFSSNMPDIYIARSGMETRQLDEKFTQTELGTLKEDFAEMQQAVRIEKEHSRRLEESMRLMQENFEEMSQILKLNPSQEQIETALRRKTGQNKP